MGMSSSQARLLSLTGRMHDIELKAQRIQAQKLRLANESDKVYTDYLIALDAKKLQYRSLSSDGTVTYKDATMNALQNGIKSGWAGDTSQEVLFLQDTNGRMYITPWVANQYDLHTTEVQTKTLDQYLADRGHRKDKATPIYRTDWFDDTEKVTGVNLIQNQVTEPDISSNHSGYDKFVENKMDGKFDPSELTAFATFKTAGITITNSADIVISSANDLFALNGQSKSGSIILKNDIEIDPTDERWANWTGINLSNATFNGNGHTIKGLSGKQGLFATASNSTIQNVKVEISEQGINAGGNSNVGGLIGSATTTEITNCCTTGGKIKGSTDVGGLIGKYDNSTASKNSITQVYSTCDVEGSSNLGGLIGEYKIGVGGRPTFNHAFATGDVTGNSEIGGLVGRYYCDPDKGKTMHPNYNGEGYDRYGRDMLFDTTVTDLFAGGKLSGSSSVGGLAGYFNCYDDYQDQFIFDNIIICSKLPAYDSTKSIGIYIGSNYNSSGVNSTAENRFSNSSYGVGINPEYESQSPKIFIGKVESGGSQIPDGAISDYTVYGRIPSREALVSNIEAALIKSGKYDPCHPDAPADAQSVMQNKIRIFLNHFDMNDQNDLNKLWSLNENLKKYLVNNDLSVSNLGTLLYTDVMSPDSSNWQTATYQSNATTTGRIKFGSGDAWNVTSDHSPIQGSVVIPSRSNIADEIYYSLMKDRVSPAPDRNAINNYINNMAIFPDSYEGKARLAKINDMINAGEYSAIYYNYIVDGTPFTDTGIYNETDYAISVSAGTITPSYEKKRVDTLVETKYDWHWEEDGVKRDAAMWRFSLKGIQEVTEEQASDPEYLKNFIVNGFGTLTSFNPENAKNLPENIADMDDAQYEDLMGIKNTSIAENTTVQEVSDQTNVKKAEAEYEAKMRRINTKDARCDQELSVCETERQAIKNEMDTLKTTIRDNVDLNFKLFS